MRNHIRTAGSQRGFSLVELMVSSVVMMIVLAGAMTSFSQAIRAHETVTLLADSNQALRSGTIYIVRDLLQAGWGGIPIGGVPIPNGGTAEPVARPSPPGLSYQFRDDLGVIPAVMPGAGLGPDVSGAPTDMVTMLYVDNNTPINLTDVTMSDDGTVMTVPSTTSITEPENGIQKGDFIMFSNAFGFALQEVTKTNGQTVYFENTDISNLNQPTVNAGSIKPLKGGGSSFPPIAATRIKMITYFLDKTTDPDAPRLVRQENFRYPRAMDDLQLTYDLVDGVTNPTNVEDPTSPGPNQIRKVNLEVGVRSEELAPQSRKYARNRVKTQISLRSLAFVNRYE